jgi:iron complex outermembrane receptor protein
VLIEQETLSNASEQELGIYGAIEAGVGRRKNWEEERAQGNRSGPDRADQSPPGDLTLLAGGRFVSQIQRNPGFESVDDSALTSFLGAVVPLSERFELTGNLGSGLRFPSISERFFIGTTGRGLVIGNPDLEPERSLSADLGLRWTGRDLFVTGAVFRNEIDDYIERIEIAPDRLTFVNLSSGEIVGVEVDGAWQASTGGSLSFGGHAMAGEDGTGRTLADIPADRLVLGWSFEGDTGRWHCRWERRFDKSDIGGGEKAIDGADLVSASFSWRWRPDLELRLSARNILDENYFNAADQKVALSPGRSIAVSVEWNQDR